MEKEHIIDKKEFLITGGISGAITDPNSIEAIRHAKMYYEEIRSFNTDVEKIAFNTEYSREQILMIKEYLFINTHILADGIRRFDPCFEIAESWRRLAFDAKNIKPHDLVLLQHELMEMDLVQKGFSQETAHRNSSKLYNYSKASSDFYFGLNENTEAGNNMIAGAITRLQANTH